MGKHKHSVYNTALVALIPIHGSHPNCLGTIHALLLLQEAFSDLVSLQIPIHHPAPSLIPLSVFVGSGIKTVSLE